jgi:hypothetical protein
VAYETRHFEADVPEFAALEVNSRFSLSVPQHSEKKTESSVMLEDNPFEGRKERPAEMPNLGNDRSVERASLVNPYAKIS